MFRLSLCGANGEVGRRGLCSSKVCRIVNVMFLTCEVAMGPQPVGGMLGGKTCPRIGEVDAGVASKSFSSAHFQIGTRNCQAPMPHSPWTIVPRRGRGVESKKLGAGIFFADGI